MGVKYPDFLVAIDKKRKRVFVMAAPHLLAVKKDEVWYYGEGITDEEIKLYYELITDLKIARSWIEEAKVELNLI
jgi:hypothetical protein